MNEKRRAGFALPAVLLALTVMAVLSTAGFFAARQEVQISHSDESGKLAFYLSERANRAVMANWNSPVFGALPIDSSATVADTSDLGTVSVEVTRAGPRLYYLDARSEVTQGGPLLSGARHRTGTIARLQVANLEPRAALTTRNNLTIKGTAYVDGMDVDPAAWSGVCASPPRNKPGLLIDDSTGFGSTGGGDIDGVPPIVEDPTLGTSDFSQFGDFDWDDLVAIADKRLPGGTFNQTGEILDSFGNCSYGHPLNWGAPETPSSPCFLYFPVIHINGSARMQSGGVGQGILLVEGDLDLRGGFVFYGIILVKGNFETQGSGNRVNGAVMAANADLENQSVVGDSEVQFSACAVDRTLENVSGLTRARPLHSRSWVDLSGIIY